MKIGLVLGGGGARGLAHIGVIKVLQKYGIPIDIIVGTSAGALIGAVYAQNPDAEFLEKHFRKFIFSDKFKSLVGARFRRQNYYEPEDLLHEISRKIKQRVIINLAAHRKSLVKTERFATAIRELVREELIEDTKIPFGCIAVDLVTGEEVVFTSGKIRNAILASAAIPGFVAPVSYANFQLVDGSVSNNFPIEIAKKLGADIIIASNVSLSFDAVSKPDNVVDIIMRSHMAAIKKLNEQSLNKADFVVSPPIGSMHWSEFEKIDLLVDYGVNETERIIQDIKKTLAQRTNIFSRIKMFILKFLKRCMQSS